MAHSFFSDDGDSGARDSNSKDLLPIKFSSLGYSIIYKAYRCYHQTLAFNILKTLFPDLGSVSEFLTSGSYIGDFPITFVLSGNAELTREDQFEAAKAVLQIISDYVQTIDVTYRGTEEFYATPLRDVFTDTEKNITREKDDESWGGGISQNDSLVNDAYRIDLSDKDWYAYNDNYGTSEEKKFVKYFSSLVSDLKQKFDGLYLIRNELQACIYSFDDGAKFEPDYVLILTKNQDQGSKKSLYVCMFIEPKGEHLLQKDSWKNKLLLDLEQRGIPVVKFTDDNEYLIWGAPLYNESTTKAEFKTYFDELIKKV